MQDKVYSPEQSASFWSALYFRWVQPTLREGMRQPLEVATLLPLCASELPETVDPAFSAAFAGMAGRSRPILRAMWQLHRSTFVRVFLLSMVHVVASVGSPLVLRRLVLALGSNASGPAISVGDIGNALLLFVTALATSMSAHHMFHRMLKLMSRVRIQLVAAIYRKSLRLTVDARQQAPAGQIINLMGTDAQKVVNSLNVIQSLWMHPLQLIAVLVALYWILGPATLAGTGILLFFFYLSAWNARRHIRARKLLVQHTDERVGLMNEILMSIRIIKFYAWESSFTREVGGIRKKEVKELSKLARISAIGSLLFLSSPVVVAVATFATFVLMGKALNAADVFSALALFTVLRQAMVTLPDVAATCLEANVSIQRIERFMALPELSARRTAAAAPGTILVENAWVNWTPSAVALRDLNLTVKPGELVTVVGTVGSGKSALMSALLGDLEVTAGRLEVAGRIAFVSQQAWILNDTIRNNILFGLPYDERRYERALSAAALTYDLTHFAASDQTEIGERGVNLSGGQRQRISLARAIYSDADVVLLDDPLSALDNKVGQDVFEGCLLSELAGKTRILATHRLEFVDAADRVLVLHGGRIVDSGSPRMLRKDSGAFSILVKAYAHEGTFVSEATAPRPVDLAAPAPRAQTPSKSAQSRLMTDEERNVGVVGWSVYKLYLAALAPSLILAGLALVFISKEVLNVGTDSWLAYWSSGDFKLALFLGGYLALGLGACGTTYIRSLIVSLRGLTAGTRFHSRLLNSVLRAPMSFFEGTPVGRILNRFSRDMEAIDQQIPRSLLEAVACVCSITSTLAVIIAVTPWALVAIAPIGAVYYRVQRQFRPASREGQRLDSVTRSPVFAQFSESLAGCQVIRAFGAEERFEQELLQHLETNTRSFYTIVSANRWLGTRIETLGAAIVGTAAFAGVLSKSYVSPGFVGLSVTYSLAITGAMNWAVRMFSQVESNLNSVERVDHYTKLSAEAWNGDKAPANWPTAGAIAFESLELRYRKDLPPVVRDFSCQIQSGEKVGVVGRTGAGKSSLLLGLFRVIEPSGGRILIDGIDVAKLALADLRAGLAIIPQEPVLFRGTVRKNLDPFGSYSDERLWDALARAELQDFIGALPGGLGGAVTEGGGNFSVGQRQLLCLARAVLKRSRILLMDEATASVDVVTDALIQRTIRTEFEQATVITIAHRLSTVMDCDRIMVLDAGKVVEFDAPRALLSDRQGAFARLLKDERHGAVAAVNS